MSEADHNYDPAEMDVIQEKMKHLFPDGTDFEKKLYQTIREYNSFDKTKLYTLFEDSFKHFGEDKPELYNDLREIILADGKILNSETKALEALKNIIDKK